MRLVKRIHFVRECMSCGSVLGTVRCVIALKRCPECGVSIVPVEDKTRGIHVEQRTTNKIPT